MNLLQKIFIITENDYEYCLYDNACHLAESIKAHKEVYPILENLSCFIDKFHLKNHVRDCCHTTYNPYLNEQLNKINTQACEQKFSVINKHVYGAKHMSQHHFLFYFLCVFDSLNDKLMDKL